MKTTVNQEPKWFQPVTISITFETQKELDQWLDMRGDVSSWISDPSKQDLFCNMFPAATTYFGVSK